jgi:hypothetical protein
LKASDRRRWRVGRRRPTAWTTKSGGWKKPFESRKKHARGKRCGGGGWKACVWRVRVEIRMEFGLRLRSE